MKIVCPRCKLDNREVVLGEIIGEGTIAIARQRSKYSFEEATLVTGLDWSIICGYCRGTAFYRKEEQDENRSIWITRVSWITFGQNGITQKVGSVPNYPGTFIQPS